MRKTIRQGGFTLIEIVVVIMILAILVAFAVPRVLSLETQARLAATQALGGSVRSGAALAHALWLVQGDPSSTKVTMEGRPVTMLNGYPDDESIAATLTGYTGFVVTTRDDSAVFTKQSSSGSPIAGCFVTYTAARTTDSAPSVATTTRGC
jgi:MSHA pilin protein MshA